MTALAPASVDASGGRVTASGRRGGSGGTGALPDAWREVRHHPGRVLATVVSIALGVAFLAAVTTFLAVQKNALAGQQVITSSRGDVVVSVGSVREGVTSSALRQRIAAAAGAGSQVEQVREADWITARAGAQVSGTPDPGAATAYVTVVALPSTTFRWSSLSTGAWPTAYTSGREQITLSRQVADALHVGMGDAITLPLQGTASRVALQVVGITDDPRLLSAGLAYVDPASRVLPDADSSATSIWVVRLPQGSRGSQGSQSSQGAAAARDRIDQALAPLAGTDSGSAMPGDPPIAVNTQAQWRDAAVIEAGRGVDAARVILLGFTAVALVVATIIVATTFTILLAQRRRQIGLLRAVGASGAQVRGRLLAEALLLGVMGSLLGAAIGVVVGLVGGLLSHALDFGVVLPWGSLVWALVVGVVMTLVAAIAPAIRATRVSPLEALRPVATAEQGRRSLRLRAVLCGLMALVGAGILTLSWRTQPMLTAVAGSALLAVAILLAAPLYVPPLLGVLGRLISPLGPTARLAAENARRNPARASATATALMLAVGLIVTLQVGTASVRSSVLSGIQDRYPIDMSLTVYPGSAPASGAQLPASVIAAARSARNVQAAVTLQGELVTTDAAPTLVLVWTPDLAQIPAAPAEPPAGTVWTARLARDTLRVTGVGSRPIAHPQVFRTQGTPALGDGIVIMSRADAARLQLQPKPVAVWMRLTDTNRAAQTVGDLTPAVDAANSAASSSQGGGWIDVSGGAVESSFYTRVLDVLMWVVTALLGVSAVIALIGVGNTLGLSVLERRRESALLRAMGMQRSSLRLMLLWEALLLALAGVVVGTVMGVVFGWLGEGAIVRQVNNGFVTPRLAIDWWPTVGMLAVALLASALASVVPGRRAAMAPPVAALADD